MRAGGYTIMLPDQVPGVGDGEWVEFFGRPAYTMTLVGRLQQASDAAIVFYFAAEAAARRGFHRAFPRARRPASARPARGHAPREPEVEELVRMCPVQYLWGYNRYKRPAGAPPPPSAQRTIT